VAAESDQSRTRAGAGGRAWRRAYIRIKLLIGWNSVWKRFVARLLKETKIDQRFTEHDLPAKCVSVNAD